MHDNTIQTEVTEQGFAAMFNPIADRGERFSHFSGPLTAG